ncbi:hypothetical protein BKA63DRAFT_523196 [Paraphoma chrysanthemicola]|nr:hypothetical protein BKA63DRAFT_523196 [Paraphoma chrysanthemicola]
MSRSARFERIAQDLEKLPAELHEGVLVDLEFEQLIRLSLHAGPRLIWSLENSPSPWGKFFRGGMDEWQTFLKVNDQARKLCFKPPKSREDRPEDFTRTGFLAFVHYRTLDWSSRGQPWWVPLPRELDREGLMRYWLERLTQLVVNSRLYPNGNYKYLIEPWPGVPEVEGAADLFNNVHTGTTSIKEVADFIEAYQQIRINRAQALATQLNRLADLYEAHPQHLKEPFAPQSPRPNEKHIAIQMRCEALQIVRRAQNRWWGTRPCGVYRFNRRFLPLIPYDRSTEIYNQNISKLRQAGTVTFEEIEEKGEAVSREWPEWEMIDANGFPVSYKQNPIGHIQWTKSQRMPLPHSEVHLKWLENIVNVIAWIEENVLDTRKQEDVGIATKTW